MNTSQQFVGGPVQNTGQKNPYVVMVSGILIMLMLGVAYVWGVYVNPLQEFFGWSKTQASLPFSFFLLIYTIGMILGGKMQDKYGPTLVCTIGVVLFSVGYFLTSFTNTLPQMIFTYGLMGGVGTGFAYSTAVVTAMKWFPHKRGLAAGNMVFGFGMGAFILSPVTRWLITNYGWRPSFLYLGLIFFIVTFIASRFIILPSAEWVQSKTAGTGTATVRPSIAELTPAEVLRSNMFYIAWIIWFFNLTVGLGTMAHIVSYAMLNGVEKMAAAFMLSIIAIFNGVGRVLIGAISDKLGRLRILSAASFLFAMVLLLLPYAGKNLLIYYPLCALFGIAFGSCMVLYPAAASDMFGVKHLGTNYGLLFSSYGVGGLFGPFIFGEIFDSTGSYLPVFYGAATATIISAVLSLVLRHIGITKLKQSK